MLAALGSRPRGGLSCLAPGPGVCETSLEEMAVGLGSQGKRLLSLGIPWVWEGKPLQDQGPTCQGIKYRKEEIWLIYDLTHPPRLRPPATLNQCECPCTLGQWSPTFRASWTTNGLRITCWRPLLQGILGLLAAPQEVQAEPLVPTHILQRLISSSLCHPPSSLPPAPWEPLPNKRPAL